MQFQPPQQPTYFPPQQPQEYPQQPYYTQQWQPQPYYPAPMPQYMMSNQIVNVVNVGAQQSGTQQLNVLIRLLYFVFIGWWLGLSWAFIAVAFCITIIGLPIGIVMFHFLPAVLTLQQH